MKKVLIIGGGSFGTCLTNLIAENGDKPYLWERSVEVRKIIKEKNENTVFLPGIKLSSNIEVVDSYGETLKNENINFILLATPTQHLRSVLQDLEKHMHDNMIIINVAKGIEIKTGDRISEIINEVLGKKKYRYVQLTGPTHAEEVAKKIPSAILSVSEDKEAAIQVQKLLSNAYFRVYTGTDLIGAELGGALKNCIAIAAGMIDGLGLGDNTKAAILTRGLNEMVKIGTHFGAKEKTFMGLSGLGDMIVTCTSKHSRNRYVGEELGKGKKIEDIISGMKMVSEGAETIKAVYKMIKDENIEVPIFSELYKVIYENKDVKELFTTFMFRELKSEF